MVEKKTPATAKTPDSEYIRMASLRPSIDKRFLDCQLKVNADVFAFAVANNIASFRRFEDGGISVSVKKSKLADARELTASM